MKQVIKKQQGFFLIEVIVAASVIAVVLVLLLGAIQNSIEVSERALERTQTAYLLEEGAEVLKAIRDNSWSTIAGLTTNLYYPTWNGSNWTLSTTANTIGKFTRSIVCTAVARDTGDDIVETGGTTDTGSKKCTITVSWQTPSGTQTKFLSLYITNIIE